MCVNICSVVCEQPLNSFLISDWHCTHSSDSLWQMIQNLISVVSTLWNLAEEHEVKTEESIIIVEKDELVSLDGTDKTIETGIILSIVDIKTNFYVFWKKIPIQGNLIGPY